LLFSTSAKQIIIYLIDQLGVLGLPFDVIDGERQTFLNVPVGLQVPVMVYLFVSSFLQSTK